MPTSNTSKTITKHFLLAAPLPTLGRIRPVISVVCKLVTADASLIVTVLCLRSMVPLVQKDIQRTTLPKLVQSRVRVVGIGQCAPPAHGVDPGEAYTRMLNALPADVCQAYEIVAKGGNLTCTHTAKTFDYHGIPRVSVALVESFTPLLSGVIKDLTPHVVVVSIWPISVSAFLDAFAPSEYGGMGDFEEQAKKAMKSGDVRPIEEIAKDLLAPQSGKVEKRPNGMRIFDYEAMPQGAFATRNPFPLSFYTQTIEGLAHADAVLCCSTSTFDSKSTQVLRRWWEKKLGKMLLFAGPQISRSQGRVVSASSSAPDSFSHIFAFLDAQPAKSVMLISFGTIFYPSEKPWMIETVVKTLLNTRTPFILSRAAIRTIPFSPELEKVLVESDLALVADYVPNREALEHPSMGTFLTHGGVNSLWEGILAGVLSIFWPFMVDQPTHAAYMSESLDCAFELLQVRTGAGARPPYRGGKIEGTPEAVASEFNQVLVEIKGEIGQRKRKNLEAVRQRLLDATKEGGEAEVDLKRVLNLASV
ncbi:hypothetical protein FRB94_008292 [Tulasnella sp. JGI-2019a]|nr:hypothetical protein FRB93_006987 [Tulasnella sp. JGI-2019a]KAG9011461.1 hypothetical protein FRB94_008292 [Tulasnella sp. JGI-2019a]